MSSDPLNDKKNLPPWLRDVPLPPRPRDLAAPGAPAQSGAADQTALPSAWLGETSAAADQPAPMSSQPSWLGETSGAAAQPSNPNDQSGLPDWLRDSQANQSSTSGSAGQLPSWLHDIAGTPAAPEQPVEAPPAASPAGEVQLPDWLRESQRDAASTQPEQVPDWLRDMAGATPDHDEPQPAAPQDQPAETSAAENDYVPDWLRDQGHDSPPVEAQHVSPLPPPVPDEAPADLSAAGASDQSTPDWLRDISNADEVDSDVLPFTFDEAAGSGSTTGASSLPAWLGSADDAEDTSAVMPDWLKDSGSQAATPHQEPAAADVPSWLADTDAQPPAPSDSAPGRPDVPLWLQDIDNQAADVAPAAAPPEEWAETLDTEQVPSWLQDTPAAQPPAAADVPSWLNDASSEQPAQEPPATELPTWLQESPAAQAAEAPADVAPGAFTSDMPEPDTLPEWLRPAAAPQAPPTGAAQDIPPWLRDEAGQPLPTASAPGDTNLPAWLRGATLDRAPVPASSPPQSGSTNFDWFTDESAPALPEPAASNATNELVGGIELPAWLRPPEPEQPKELNPTDARSLDWLTRLGGHEEEESLSAIAAPAYRLRPPAAPTRTPAQIEAIGLLQRLAAQPYPEIEPIAAAEAPSIWRQLGFERLLYLAMLLTLVVALALPISGSIGLNTPLSAPGAEDLFAQIDRLTPGDTVLVGYEWDARRSGELRPLEQAVLGHLIQRNVKLVLVSTDAQGTLLLFDLRDELGAAGYQPSGEDYILLGYKPGAEFALRSLAQDFRGALRSDFQGNDATMSGLATNPDGQPRLNSLTDFAMVMVLADEPADVQGWMEQVRTSAKKADGSFVPLGFVLPAETAPIVQPYLSQPNVFHLSGKQGALAYQRLRGQNATTATQIAGEQRMSLLIYVVLFLVGAVGVGVSSAVARGRKRP